MQPVPKYDPVEQALIDSFRNRNQPAEQLFAQMYAELRRIARAYMRKEHLEQTLQSTALVHEAYLRLFEGQGFHWENQKHFVCLVARCMRRILVDHARSHKAQRHGGDYQKTSLADQAPAQFRDPDQLIALDAALSRLAALNPRQARVVELYSFAGWTEEETAELLDVSVKTVKNDWRFAKAWLKTELDRMPPDAG